MEIYEQIKKMFQEANKPLAIWKVYNELRKKYTENQIRLSLKWLFEHSYLKWEKEGVSLIPVEKQNEIF